jgi:hypothetical protein
MFAELYSNLLHLVLGFELPPGTYCLSPPHYSTTLHTKLIRSYEFGMVSAFGIEANFQKAAQVCLDTVVSRNFLVCRYIRIEKVEHLIWNGGSTPFFCKENISLSNIA